jgi:tyrosyl-tRNA synthetase
LRKLREFQDLGHQVVLIIGDYTARVGDPSGRSATRPILDPAEIARNAETFRDQAVRVLDPDPARLELRYNGEWLDMPLADVLGLARTATVAQLLERDDFAGRYQAGEPISILELLYPLMQGYDSVAIRADVELGGTDQRFNLLLGRQIQRTYGQPEQAILTMPILVGTDGREKMSKSLGNQIGVTEPPEEIYGKTLSIPDAALGDYFRLLLGEEPRDLAPRDAKRELARRLVARFYDEAAAADAERSFDRLFIEHSPPDEIEDFEFRAVDGSVHLPAVIAEAFGMSRSEARRLLEQGGVGLDDRVLSASDLDLAPEELDGRILRAGKRRFRRMRQAA